MSSKEHGDFLHILPKIYVAQVVEMVRIASQIGSNVTLRDPAWVDVVKVCEMIMDPQKGKVKFRLCDLLNEVQNEAVTWRGGVFSHVKLLPPLLGDGSEREILQQKDLLKIFLKYLVRQAHVHSRTEKSVQQTASIEGRVGYIGVLTNQPMEVAPAVLKFQCFSTKPLARDTSLALTHLIAYHLTSGGLLKQKTEKHVGNNMLFTKFGL